MSRSVFQKNFNAQKNYLAARSIERLVEVDCIILDVVGYEGKIKSVYLRDEEFRTNLHFIVALSYNGEIVAIPLKDMSYDELRANYGTDSNIIGRELLIKSRSVSKQDLVNGFITFRSGFNNIVALQDDCATNIPVSMGGMAGLEYRAEDRMFYNKNMSSQPGNVWGELRPRR